MKALVIPTNLQFGIPENLPPPKGFRFRSAPDEFLEAISEDGKSYYVEAINGSVTRLIRKNAYTVADLDAMRGTPRFNSLLLGKPYMDDRETISF